MELNGEQDKKNLELFGELITQQARQLIMQYRST